MSMEVIAMPPIGAKATFHFDPKQARHLSWRVDLRRGVIPMATRSQDSEEPSERAQPRQGQHAGQKTHGCDRDVLMRALIAQCLQKLCATMLEIPVDQLESTTACFVSGGAAFAIAARLSAQAEQCDLEFHPQQVCDHPLLAKLTHVFAKQQPQLPAPSWRRAVPV